MAAHSDATGYLLAHRDSVKEEWFHAVCEAAINSDGGNLSPDELERLWRLFCRARNLCTCGSYSPSAESKCTRRNPTVSSGESVGLLWI